MRVRRLWAYSVAWLVLASTAPGQQYAHLAGNILDSSGAGVPGAAVSVVNEETGFRRSTQSQPDGSYTVAAVEPGTYKITVRREGFRTVVRFGVKLEGPRANRVNFTLPLGSMQETITVEGTAPLLNREDATLGTLIVRDEIERMPLNGRGLLTLLELSPGTVATPASRGEAGQFTVNGQRPNTHYFTVDGVSANTGVSGGGVPAQATGGTLPGMSAFGSMHSLISLEALQELRVQTSTAVPEFGRLPGANVAITSRSGSNDLHGTVVEHFRHDKFDANDWFANRHGDPPAPLRLHDFGASLGGPLERDRMFFFLSYEGLRLRQPFAWRSPVPSDEARRAAPAAARRVFDLFPAPNGPDLGRDLAEWSGRNRRPSRLDVGSLRVDRAFGSRVTAFLRYNQSPSFSEFGSSQINRLDLDSRTVTLGVNVRPLSRAVLDVRINFAGARVRSQWMQNGAVGPAGCELEPITSYFLHSRGQCDYLVRLSVAGAGRVMVGREGERRQSQFQIVQNASISFGRHAIRLGADYRRLRPVRRDSAATLSVIADTVDDLTDPLAVWIANSPRVSADGLLEELSLSAQDTWRITGRLTATYGLRWEFNPAPVSSQPAYYLDPSRQLIAAGQRPIWPARYTNLAPRLGVAYALDPASRWILRAGGGLYYDSSLSIATDLINGGPLNVSQFSSGRHAPFSMLLSYGFMPDLRLPLVNQWSATLEHALSAGEAISLGYAGSSGRRLIRREVGGPGSTATVWAALATNHGSSDYSAFQLQYRRRVARGLHGLLSYAWSHSLDDSSSDTLLHWADTGFTPRRDRASSDFDVRHALTAALTQDIPRLRSRILRDWAVEGILRARTGFPLTVLNAEHYTGLSLANVFRPNLVGGQPVWIADGSVPSGKRLNRAAFQLPRGAVQGNLGRNAISGFGMFQVDLALRRDFRFGEARAVEFRLEAFNALNHPNFADPTSFLISPLFGQSGSMLNFMLGTGSPGSGLAPMFQIGGARSIQTVLRIRF